MIRVGMVNPNDVELAIASLPLHLQHHFGINPVPPMLVESFSCASGVFLSRIRYLLHRKYPSGSQQAPVPPPDDRPASARRPGPGREQAGCIPTSSRSTRRDTLPPPAWLIWSFNCSDISKAKTANPLNLKQQRLTLNLMAPKDESVSSPRYRVPPNGML